MKLLLIYPPTSFTKQSYLPNIHLPLSLLYLAASLERRAGFEVEIYDTRLSAKLSSEGRFIHFGDRWNEIEKYIYKSNPDVVGITNLSFAQIHNVNRIAEIVKKIQKDKLVIVGGQHPSACPDDLLENNNIDIVIKGEGEEALAQLLEKIKMKQPIDNIGGVITRNNLNAAESLPVSPILNLDDLPLPAYHLYDMERYFYLNNTGFSSRFRRRGRRPVSIITSRGCPFNCIFCLGHAVMGKKWRAHSVEYVMRHINFLIQEFKIDLVHFEDDNINFDYRRFEDLLIKLNALKGAISWDTPNGLRADNLDEAILAKARKSNCDYLIMGVESGEQRILNQIIKKSLNLTDVNQAAKLSRLHKIRLFAFFVIGFPGEKIADMQKSINFALDLFWRYDVIPAIFWASPYKGTRLYNLCKENGYFIGEVNAESFIDDHQLDGKMLIQTEDFSPRDIKKLLRQFRRRLKLYAVIKCIFFPKLALEYMRMVWQNNYLVRDYLKGHYENSFN